MSGTTSITTRSLSPRAGSEADTSSETGSSTGAIPSQSIALSGSESVMSTSSFISSSTISTTTREFSSMAMGFGSVIAGSLLATDTAAMEYNHAGPSNQAEGLDAVSIAATMPKDNSVMHYGIFLDLENLIRTANDRFMGQQSSLVVFQDSRDDSLIDMGEILNRVELFVNAKSGAKVREDYRIYSDVEVEDVFQLMEDEGFQNLIYERQIQKPLAKRKDDIVIDSASDIMLCTDVIMRASMQLSTFLAARNMTLSDFLQQERKPIPEDGFVPHTAWRYTHVVLVTGDSYFVPLINKLHDMGIYVIGASYALPTNLDQIKAYDEFVFLPLHQSSRMIESVFRFAIEFEQEMTSKFEEYAKLFEYWKETWMKLKQPKADMAIDEFEALISTFLSDMPEELLPSQEKVRINKRRRAKRQELNVNVLRDPLAAKVMSEFLSCFDPLANELSGHNLRDELQVVLRWMYKCSALLDKWATEGIDMSVVMTVLTYFIGACTAEYGAELIHSDAARQAVMIQRLCSKEDLNVGMYENCVSPHFRLANRSPFPRELDPGQWKWVSRDSVRVADPSETLDKQLSEQRSSQKVYHEAASSSSNYSVALHSTVPDTFCQAAVEYESENQDPFNDSGEFEESRGEGLDETNDGVNVDGIVHNETNDTNLVRFRAKDEDPLGFENHADTSNELIHEQTENRDGAEKAEEEEEEEEKEKEEEEEEAVVRMALAEGAGESHSDCDEYEDPISEDGEDLEEAYMDLFNCVITGHARISNSESE